MKACIVTVYNSTNCGSYLQAYGLKYALENLGAEVSYLKTGIKDNRKLFLRKSIKNIKKGRFGKIGFDFKVLQNFEKALKLFPLTQFTDSEIEKQDLFLLGSDEIWNASRKVMQESEVFFGKGLKKRVVSYAPSVNVATKEDLLKIAEVEYLLSKMEKISVRDDYSREVISTLTDKKVEILCDPTFLVPMEEYNRIEGICPVDNYVMVYSAGARFSSEDKKRIKAFAASKGKKLVAFPHKLDWCDCQFPADPFNAIAFFKNADYVITDTFHGAALSLIFNRDFAAIPKENKKVTQLLNYFDVPQLELEGTENLEEFFSIEQYSKETLNEKILLERNKAKDYLAAVLNS